MAWAVLDNECDQSNAGCNRDLRYITTLLADSVTRVRILGTNQVSSQGTQLVTAGGGVTHMRQIGRTMVDAVQFDPMSNEYFQDPYGVYRRLRDESPVYWNEKYGFYALSRYEDVNRAHLDTASFSSTYGVEFFNLLDGEQHDEALRSIITMDPPQHTRMRKLLVRVFTPRAILALEPMIREVICELLDGLGDRPTFDGVSDFAAYFPVEIISRMLGVPQSDRQSIRQLTDDALHRSEGQAALNDENMAAFAGLFGYFNQLSIAKRGSGADDIGTHLTEVEMARADGVLTRLTDEEIGGFCALLGAAGAETVTKLIGNAIVLFHRHPAEWQRLLKDRNLAPLAVEEALRYQPPSQYQGRFSVKDSDFDGVTLKAGYPVLLLTGSAARDERQYENPDAFDITRPKTQSLAFGIGIHVCLGAHLARLEAKVALEELAARYPRFAVDESGLRRVQMSNVAGYSQVPVITNS